MGVLLGKMMAGSQKRKDPSAKANLEREKPRAKSHKAKSGNVVHGSSVAGHGTSYLFHQRGWLP